MHRSRPPRHGSLRKEQPPPGRRGPFDRRFREPTRTEGDRVRPGNGASDHRGADPAGRLDAGTLLLHGFRRLPLHPSFRAAARFRRPESERQDAAVRLSRDLRRGGLGDGRAEKKERAEAGGSSRDPGTDRGSLSFRSSVLYGRRPRIRRRARKAGSGLDGTARGLPPAGGPGLRAGTVRTQRGAAGGLRGAERASRRAGTAGGPSLRRHRKRQDTGLHPPDRRGPVDVEISNSCAMPTVASIVVYLAARLPYPPRLPLPFVMSKMDDTPA